MPYQLFAMPQRMGDFELALDAPRRLEPFSTSDPRYGDIPIQITINDAYLPNDVATRFLQRLVEIEQTGVYREKNSPFTLLPHE